MEGLHKPGNTVILAHATELRTVTSPGKCTNVNNTSVIILVISTRNRNNSDT